MRLFDIRKQELPALGWAAAWFFCVLAAYYTIRPVRETFATELSRDQRAALFIWTLAVMLLATPLYGLVVARIAKKWLVIFVYGFFITNLMAFAFLLSNWGVQKWTSSAFFIWISVFNLFVVTLFWGTVVDLFSGDQGKRLFGLIFGAGTLGQFTSSWLVQELSHKIPMEGLLGVSVLFLIGSVFCSWQLRRLLQVQNLQSEVLAKVPGKSWLVAWQGVLALARSPYLIGICAFVTVISFCATVAYFQMTDMVAAQLPEPEDRLRWFAKINSSHAVLTLVLQAAVVSWLLRKIGVGATLALVPIVYCAGFATFSWSQSLLVVGVFQVALRAVTFSLGNPALEVLFTAVTPAQKYRAKAFIDTVGKRTGDVLGAQGYAFLISLGWLASNLSLALLPILIAMVALGLLMGSAHFDYVSENKRGWPKGE